MTVPQGALAVISTYMRTGTPLGGIYTGTRIGWPLRDRGSPSGSGGPFGEVLFLVFRHGRRVLQLRAIWRENGLCRSLFRRDVKEAAEMNAPGFRGLAKLGAVGGSPTPPRVSRHLVASRCSHQTGYILELETRMLVPSVGGTFSSVSVGLKHPSCLSLSHLPHQWGETREEELLGASIKCWS